MNMNIKINNNENCNPTIEIPKIYSTILDSVKEKFKDKFNYTNPDNLLDFLAKNKLIEGDLYILLTSLFSLNKNILNNTNNININHEEIANYKRNAERIIYKIKN